MPLLSPSTVQAVKNLPVDAVIGSYLTLKKTGPALKACCPFHEEKTPSFTVNPKRGTWKCFGCHVGGGVLDFVMRHERLEFLPAVEELAGKHGIPLEYETNLTPEQLAAEQQRRDANKDKSAALEWAAEWFAATDLPDEFGPSRGLDDEMLRQVRAGYAPKGGKELFTAAQKQGHFGPALLAAGLIREVHRDNRNDYYDMYQDRAMLPIRDWRGNVVAFTGRRMTTDEKIPKYINSPDTTWQKGAHLYGLDRAGNAIEKLGYVIVVEGHFDAVQMWQQGILNTVALGGTAFTEEHIALVQRYTRHVVLCYDHDSAGQQALDKYAPVLLAAGLQVSFLVPADAVDGRYPAVKSDPDDYLQHLVAKARQPQPPAKKKRGKKEEPADELTPDQRLRVLVEGWLRSRKDFIEGRATVEAMRDAALGPVERAGAIQRIGDLLEQLPNEVLRGTYYDVVAALWPEFKRGYKLSKRKATTSEQAQEALRKAKGLNVEQLTNHHNYGFFQKGNSYWTYGKDNTEVLICEFVIEILFFVVSNKVPRYVCRLTNFHNRSKVVVLTTDDFVTVSALDKAVARYNGFVFEGNQQQFNKIKKRLFAGAREAIAVDNYLGWNPNGKFYAWANGLLYNGVFYPCDKYGIVTLRHPVADAARIDKLRSESQLEIDGSVTVLNYPGEIFDTLSREQVNELAAAGKVVELTYHYLPTGATERISGYEDESDDATAKFWHQGEGTLTFADWAKQIMAVYGKDNGRTMIAYYVACLFRTTIYKANNGYFPLLYHFGMPGSGKSTAARSLAYMFGTPPNMDGINLESGSTVTGIQRTLSALQDGLVWLNEYKNTLPVRTLGMLKGIADGSGKVMGMNTGGNETRVNAPKSAAVFGGQDLPTADSALFKRCILNEFDVKEHNYAAAQQLQRHESAGHTTAVTCEVLQHRSLVAEGYIKLEPTVTRELREAGKKLLGTDADSRAILNLASVLTPCRLLMEAGALTFPCTYDELQETLLAKLRTSSQIQEVSDEIETYLITLASLPPTQFEEGFHYKIQKEGEGKTRLFLRTKQVHGMYSETMRKQGGTPLAISTLRAYLEKHKAYIENRPNTRFEKYPTATSAVVLDYDVLRKAGVELRMAVGLSDLTVVREGPGAAVDAGIRSADTLTDFLNQYATLKDGPRRMRKEKLLEDFNWNRIPAATLDQLRAGLLGTTFHTLQGPRVVQEEGADFVIAEHKPF